MNPMCITMLRVKPISTLECNKSQFAGWTEMGLGVSKQWYRLGLDLGGRRVQVISGTFPPFQGLSLTRMLISCKTPCSLIGTRSPLVQIGGDCGGAFGLKHAPHSGPVCVALWLEEEERAGLTFLVVPLPVFFHWITYTWSCPWGSLALVTDLGVFFPRGACCSLGSCLIGSVAQDKGPKGIHVEK